MKRICNHQLERSSTFQVNLITGCINENRIVHSLGGDVELTLTTTATMLNSDVAISSA